MRAHAGNSRNFKRDGVAPRRVSTKGKIEKRSTVKTAATRPKTTPIGSRVSSAPARPPRSGKHLRHQLQRCVGEQKSGAGARQADHETFGGKKSDHVAPFGTERHADADFTPAAGRSKARSRRAVRSRRRKATRRARGRAR